MKISLKTPNHIFKEPFKDDYVELSDFTIITGLNGAGKSQLLQAIDNNHITVVTDNNELLSDIKTYQYGNEDNRRNEQLRPNGGSSSYTIEDIRKGIRPLYETYLGVKENSKHLGQSISNIFLTQQQNKYYVPTIMDIITKSGKKDEDLIFEDFVQHIPMDFANSHDYKNHNFGYLFMLYVYKYNHNKDLQLLYKEGRSNTKPFTDDEFRDKFGEPPWEFVKQVLESGNLGYNVNYPSLNKTHIDERFTLAFRDKIGTPIDLSNLSSGEKVLMALTFARYNSDIGSGKFPQLILMDEPDAPLHPSMAKQFINVIQDVFVKQNGVKVIMTTHSPSTIALAPEEALYEMDKNERKPKKISKDRALKLLTADVPSLSINYENRKQVFVESKHDAYFYGKVYNKLKDKLISEISLDFISSGNDGSGSCEQVQEVVSKLNGYGNKSIYGIIDWDGKHEDNGNIKVLGNNKRYSIENYIFDPIIFAAFLLGEKLIKREEIGLSSENYTDFKSFNSSKLQSIADYIISNIQIPQENKQDSTLVEIQYHNNCKINIPNWYLIYNGHDLEKKIKLTYPKLHEYQRNKEIKKELKEAIIDRVIDDVPELIPIDIVELFKSIQQ